MIHELEKLLPAEAEQIFKSPLLVCILIAGADDDIDRKEISKAIQIAQGKQKKNNSRLVKFFQLMAEDFEDKLKVVMQSFPNKARDRNPLIVKELQQLNQILPKIDPSIAIEFYKSLLEISHAVAKSSGGLLGMQSVGEEEAKYISLPMIQAPSVNA